MYLKKKKKVGEHKGLYYLHPVAVRVTRRKKISREGNVKSLQKEKSSHNTRENHCK